MRAHFDLRTPWGPITGSVAVAVDEEPSQQQAVTAWLSNIDAQELEKAALDRLSFGDGSPIRVALATLQGWARGEP